MRKLFICLSICIWGHCGLRAQEVLPIQTVLHWVSEHHPVMRRATIVSDQAAARIRTARGAFDPVLASDLDQKAFETMEYWTMLETKLTIPTWYGVHVFGGYEFYQGNFIDPSRTVPELGLFSAGVGVSLAKGLWFDERRASLRQAQALGEAAQAEQLDMVNGLFLKVTEDYWDWAYAYQEQQVFKRSVSLAMDQLQLVRISFQQGDRPAVDTLEALLQYQSRMAALQNAQLKYNQSRLKLENHLWKEGRIPMEMDTNLTPEPVTLANQLSILTPDSLLTLNQQILQTNPGLNAQRFQIRALDLDRKLKAAAMMPQLDLTYNFLYSENTPVWVTDNYKLGVSFKAPLLLRKERGSWQQARLKVEDAQLKLSESQVKTRNLLQGHLAEYQTLVAQVSLFGQMVQNFTDLLAAERLRFDNGEATVFLVNARELSLIDAAIRLADFQRRILKTSQTIRFIAGTK